uniref:Transmembrane protein 144 n=1 Tax=Heterorhabditis bacteriophora TaxID=37862 RepID=A0A1I7WG19_HETBA
MGLKVRQNELYGTCARNARFPFLTSGLLITGIMLFCGPCYHFSITGNEVTRKLTPIGGIILIMGWLSFIV